MLKSCYVYIFLLCVLNEERFFFRLKWLKNDLRSSLTQKHFQNVGFLRIESEFVKSLDFEDAIRTFAN